MLYTDISIVDLEDTAFITLLQNSINDARINDNGDRVIIKWEGETPSWLKRFDIVIRTQEQAKVYYKKINGWS